MQIELGLLYLAVWFLMLWLGSAALEATGMERSKARFQALSALSGTGFTTKDAETVVSHSARRRIVSWLIFFGSAGFIAIVILIVLSVQSGLGNFSPGRIILVAALLVACVLVIWLGMVNRVTNALVKSFRKRALPHKHGGEFDLVHQESNYGVFRVTIERSPDAADTSLGNTPFGEPGVTVMAVERDGKVIASPSADERIHAGDALLCFGAIDQVTEIAGKGRAV